MIRPDRSRGVFETLLVRAGRVQALDAHLDRLAASVAKLYAASLPDGVRSEVLERARSLSGDHRLRVDAVPQAGKTRVAVTPSPLTASSASAAIAMPVTISGGLGAHKWCDRRQLDALAVRAGPGHVVLIADDDGQVLEAAWANVWQLQGERLLTPPADGRLLPGVARARLVSIAPTLGLDVRETSIPLTDIRTAAAAFLTSSLRVTPLISSAPIDPRIATIAEALVAGDWS